MTSTDWFVLDSDKTNYGYKETKIRAWEPGDGMYCSHNNKRSKIPCGRPVATIRRTQTNRRVNRMSDDYIASNYVVCELHVANAVKGSGYKIPSITTESEKEAREAVLAAHWDEYQAELVKRIDSKRNEQLATLPESLRAAIEAAGEDEENRED